MWLRVLSVCLLVMSIQACATQRFNVQDSRDGVDAVSSFGKMDGFFNYGIFQIHKHDAARICRGAENVRAVEYKRNFFSLLANLGS